MQSSDWKNQVKQYIWEKEIKSEKNWLVKFKDGKSRDYGKAFEYVVTDEPIDATRLRDLHLNPVIGEICKIFSDYNINTMYVNAVWSALINIIENQQVKVVEEMVWYPSWEYPFNFIMPEIKDITDISK